jgi:multiple sugar transport system permease protein
VKKLLRFTTVSVYAAVFGFPLYWVITMAFKPKVEENPPGVVIWYPHNPTWKNFKDVLGINDPGESVFATKDFSALTPLKNSFLAAGFGTLFALLVGVFAAYGIARFRAGGSQLPFQILQLRMFPPAAVVIPL